MSIVAVARSRAPHGERSAVTTKIRNVALIAITLTLCVALAGCSVARRAPTIATRSAAKARSKRASAPQM